MADPARARVAFDSTAMLDAAPTHRLRPSWAVGRRDQDDPIYRERAAMGFLRIYR